ncbi:hypothetical protein Tco_1158637, partial [Tanacetum coccineum]
MMVLWWWHGVVADKGGVADGGGSCGGDGDDDDVVEVMVTGWCGPWDGGDGVVTTGVVEVILGGDDWLESGRNLARKRRRGRR